MNSSRIPFVGRTTLMLAAIIAVFGCQSDVIRPKPPDFKGKYTGMYSWTADSLGAIPKLQPILWTFASGYLMQMDTNKVFEDNREFCDVQGTYEITDAVILHQTQPNLSADICDSTLNPTGRFVVLMHTVDSLVLVQIQGSITKRLQLAFVQP
jgi:hypothetical protein